MSFTQIYEVLYGIFNGWLTSADVMLDTLTTPITTQVEDFFADAGLISYIASDVINFFTTTLGLGDITVFGLLGFSFLSVGVVLVIVAVVFRWVLEFLPG